MENEILNFTTRITQRIFKNLYKSLAFSSNKRKVTRKSKKNRTFTKYYQRLETDSSQDENKALNSKTSNENKTQDFSVLKEEILKKDQEILQLRQKLLEVQQKLEEIQKTKLDKEDLQNVNFKSEEQEIEEEKREVRKNEKKVSGIPIEDVVFVSRKEIFAGEEGLAGSRTISRAKDRKDESKIQEIADFSRVLSKKLILDDDHLLEEKFSDSEDYEKFSSKILETERKIDENRDLPKEDYVFTEKLNDSDLKLNESIKKFEEDIPKDIENDEEKEMTKHESLFSFENQDEIANESHHSLQLSTSLKEIENASNRLDVNDTSQESLRNLESLLEKQDPKSQEDSQTKLSKLFSKTQTRKEISTDSFSDFKSPQNALPEALNGRNDLETKLENYTFEPIFPMIDPNFDKFKTKVSSIDSRLNSKQENRRSRNSSLPWIDDPEIVVEKFPEIKPEIKKKKPKPKSKSKEKNTIKNEIPTTKSSSQRKRLPMIPIKDIKPSKVRANSHGKTKKVQNDRKMGKNSRNCKDDILDDIIFDEEQDPVTWNKLMNKFRQDPIIISKLLKSKRRPITQQSLKQNQKFKPFEKIEGVEYTGLGSLNTRQDAGFLDSNFETRPISAPEFIPPSRNVATRKVQDPDWSNSVLDNYVSQNKKKFNAYGDPSLLTSQQIEEVSKLVISRSLGIEEQKNYFKKVMNSLNALKKELMLPEFWITVPPFSTESLIQALSKCSKLLRARALTVRSIELIHKRESILLEIMSNQNYSENAQKLRNLEKINEELLQVLVFWKYMELPFSSFLYLGEDYYAKIQEDNSNLATLFPEFRSNDIFKCDKSAESFLVDF